MKIKISAEFLRLSLPAYSQNASINRPNAIHGHQHGRLISLGFTRVSIWGLLNWANLVIRSERVDVHSLIERNENYFLAFDCFS